MFLLLTICTASAQFTMEGYLSNAIASTEIESIKEQQYYVAQHGFKSPIIREVELRMRASRFENGSLDDYKLRFSPINPFERKANKNYRNVVQEQLNVELKFGLNEVLRVRYQVLIDHFYLSQQISLQERQLRFFENLIKMAQSQPKRFELKDVMQLDKELLGLQLSLEKLTNERAQLTYLIRQTYAYSGQIDIKPNQLIRLDQILGMLPERLDTTGFENNLLIQNEQQKQLVAESELNIRKKESFSDMGYLQAEYRYSDNQDIGESLGLQVAVLIPVTNPDKPDLERRRLDMLEDMKQLEEDKRNVDASMEFTRMEMESLFRQHMMVSSKKSKYEQLQLTANSKSSSIDTNIELYTLLADLNSKELGLYASILEKYITQLANYGLLVESPFINYLSKDQIQFSIDL